MIANLLRHLRIKYFRENSLCERMLQRCGGKRTLFAHVREPFFTLLLQLTGLSLFGMSAGVIFFKFDCFPVATCCVIPFFPPSKQVQPICSSFSVAFEILTCFQTCHIWRQTVGLVLNLCMSSFMQYLHNRIQIRFPFPVCRPAV